MSYERYTTQRLQLMLLKRRQLVNIAMACNQSYVIVCAVLITWHKLDVYWAIGMIAPALVAYYAVLIRFTILNNRIRKELRTRGEEPIIYTP